MSGTEETKSTITPEDIHMPSNSYWPIVLAFGTFCIMAGLAINISLSIIGLIIALVATVGWVIESPFGEEAEH
jgi:cytochrome c oxidase subunit 1